MAKRNGSILSIPVEFGGVSIGETTARIGVRMNRSNIDLPTADQTFCGHRLTGRVTLGRRDEASNQQTLIDTDVEVNGSFDCKRISMDRNHFATGLTFSLGDIDVAELAKFSKGAGKLDIRDIGEIPEEAPDKPDRKVHAEAPGTLKSDGPWRTHPLSELFAGAILKSLTDAGLETVGALADYTASEKLLTDIAGIGPGKAGNIEERMIEFWASNPQAAGEREPELAEAK